MTYFVCFPIQWLHIFGRLCSVRWANTRVKSRQSNGFRFSTLVKPNHYLFCRYRIEDIPKCVSPSLSVENSRGLSFDALPPQPLCQGQLQEPHDLK